MDLLNVIQNNQSDFYIITKLFTSIIDAHLFVFLWGFSNSPQAKSEVNNSTVSGVSITYASSLINVYIARNSSESVDGKKNH